MQAHNDDLEHLVTPLDINQFEKLLKESQYDSKKTKFLIDGFRNGFDLGYLGDETVKMTAQNLKFTIGDKIELWNKVMKEVELKRYAGPFETIPFENYIQSPIGLVPKDGGKKTRLIFHLSYPRDKGTSVNSNIPTDKTSVKYPDFDEAIKLILKYTRNGKCYIGKSDLSAAFRHICMNKESWKYLVMKAVNPLDGKTYFFVDKCMPFGASISCAIFQAFSDALSHIIEYMVQQENINYLDDFFFVGETKRRCDMQLETFIQTCNDINFPVSAEKTEWSTTKLTFLGLLIDTIRKIITIPEPKVAKALSMIEWVLSKRTIELRQLERLCGYLNFLGKCIVPGRAFTRRLYTFGNGLTKRHHHLTVKKEMKMDLRMWKIFLMHPEIYSRPFFEYDSELFSTDINMYTDSAKKEGLGCGGYHNEQWFIAQWEDEFIKLNPSINYLELFAVAVAVVNWIGNYRNKKVTLFCDNMSVVHMVNNNSSKCRNCMVLIRIIVLHCMIFNVKLSAKHVMGKFNIYADLLSRMKYDEFRKISKRNGVTFANKPTPMPEILWPMDKIWIDED